MMKIIVTTDFSDNSKAGIRMAAALAKQLHAELHFLHVAYFPGHAGEPAAEYLKNKSAETEKLNNRLKSFVKPFLKNMDENDKVIYQIEEAFIPESGIMACQKKTRAGLICISTRGAGKFAKLLGTTAGNVLTQSPVPVCVVPFNYRLKPIKAIHHCCDLENPVKELKQLIPFAEALKATVKLVHFAKSDQVEKANAYLKSKLNKAGLQVEYSVIPMSGSSVVKHMLNYSERENPSVLSLFTRERKSFMQRIFNASRSEEMAFHTRVPVLVFHKK